MLPLFFLLNFVFRGFPKGYPYHCFLAIRRPGFLHSFRHGHVSEKLENKAFFNKRFLVFPNDLSHLIIGAVPTILF